MDTVNVVCLLAFPGKLSQAYEPKMETNEINIPVLSSSVPPTSSSLSPSSVFVCVSPHAAKRCDLHLRTSVLRELSEHTGISKVTKDSQMSCVIQHVHIHPVSVTGTKAEISEVFTRVYLITNEILVCYVRILIN